MARAARRLLYPSACVACEARTEADWALCPPCWREAGFLGGLVCDACGAPLPGHDDGPVRCDDCLRHPRPWSRGRAALPYRGLGRSLALALKHADRTDLARPLGLWMAKAAGPLVADLGSDGPRDGPVGGPVLVPVPVHWTRLLRRRHNQAQLLAAAVARARGLPVLPDALVRLRATRPLDGGRAARAEALEGAIEPHPRRGGALRGRAVLLVDDVLTTGETLAACARAARAAGAADVRVLVLARAARDP